MFVNLPMVETANSSITVSSAPLARSSLTALTAFSLVRVMWRMVSSTNYRMALKPFLLTQSGITSRLDAT